MTPTRLVIFCSIAVLVAIAMGTVTAKSDAKAEADCSARICPDLLVTRIENVENDSFITISNRGFQRAVPFYVMVSPAYSGSDGCQGWQPQARFFVNGLGREGTLSSRVRLNLAASARTRLVYVDSTNRVGEKNESNNWREVPAYGHFIC